MNYCLFRERGLLWVCWVCIDGNGFVVISGTLDNASGRTGKGRIRVDRLCEQKQTYPLLPLWRQGNLWRGDIKHTTSFINTVLNENWFQILFFFHMIIGQNINISWKKYVFENILSENRPEASCLTRRHNAPSYDVTGKGARNCSKKCYVTRVILENLRNGFMKGKIMW